MSKWLILVILTLFVVATNARIMLVGKEDLKDKKNKIDENEPSFGSRKISHIGDGKAKGGDDLNNEKCVGVGVGVSSGVDVGIGLGGDGVSLDEKVKEDAQIGLGNQT